MGKFESKVATSTILIFATSLCSTGEAKPYHNIKTISTVIEQPNTTSTHSENYVDEQYKTTKDKTIISDEALNYFALLQTDILPQKELDADIFEILNGMDYKIGKKERSKKVK